MASAIASSAPCCVLRLRSSGEWQDGDAGAVASFEERCAVAASAFGRVLDVRVKTLVPSEAAASSKVREVRVYFDSDSSAVMCGRRFECNGVTRSPDVGTSYENFESPSTLEFRDLPRPKEPQEMALEMGAECSEYGRVLDAEWRGDACVVSFATLQGAQAAAIALDGAAFEGVRCAAHFGRDETSPACVLANCVDEPETLDELSKVELIGDFEEVCEAFGTVTSIVVDARGVGPRGRKTQRKERGSLVRLSPPRLRPDASKS